MKSIERRAEQYRAWVEACLDDWLPAADEIPVRLHRAMRHAVFNGGKRIRPLLVYAGAEVGGIAPELIHARAAAIELIHCYSLVHDDLPTMDDDDLRRGQPTVHRAFDEATAILVGDALQSLAFGGLAAADEHAALACALLAQAAGSRGMAGGQALDLAYEACRPDQAELERMFRLKTGALIEAAVLLGVTGHLDKDDADYRTLSRWAGCLGLAFQIRDDLLDIEGETDTIGKPAGSDDSRDKSTWPRLFGIEAARRRSDQLLEQARACLETLPGQTQMLAWLGELMVHRRF